MTYATITHVAAPPPVYDVLHRELGRRVGTRIDGLLVHIGRTTDHGFDVLEVWQSKEQFDVFNDTVVTPLIAELSGPNTDLPAPHVEEFEVRGLVLPGGDILI